MSCDHEISKMYCLTSNKGVYFLFVPEVFHMYPL